ncbi:alpha/beta hydrolase family protein [Chloroflexus sp.]|uniref:alpha/beta hydrolase family protein n=1 Tax=Chloroflexus sp. TaxID=1904827 RepID=UPI00298ED1B6|nr:prolyl oligopeptidase family serine peptidase [Chloroflexus sp.]MDW8403371.1 prolyl oligopeptidase family serine peptidase [Chloroflexus sp.]
MRLSRRLWWIIVLATIVGLVAPAAAAPIRNNIVNVDQYGNKKDLPPNLLSDEEIERIDRLQNGASYPVAISEISPDDGAVLISSNEDFAFLEIATGDTVPIDPLTFAVVFPLPFFGIGSFSWQDERTIGTLALNGFATGPQDALVALYIDRFTADVSAFVVGLPDENVGIVSIAPNLTNWLILREPPSEEGDGETEAVKPFTKRYTIGLPSPFLQRENRIKLPARIQRSVDQFRQRRPDLLARFLFQQQDDGMAIEATREPYNLFLYDVTTGEERYVTSIPYASALLNSTWTSDSAQLAVSFFGVPDAEGRDTYIGSLFSEEIYRDMTGNLPPRQNPVIQNNNTYVIDFASGRTQVIRPDPVLGAPILEAHDWAPGGQALLIKAHHPAYLKGRTHPVYYPRFSSRTSFRFYDRDSSGQFRLTKTFEHPMLSGADVVFGSIADFVSPDEIIVRGVVGSNRHPYYYNRVSGELRNLADRAGSYFNVVATSSSTRQIVFTYTSYTAPPDIYRLRWDGTALYRLTWLNEELRVEANLRQDPVTFTLRNGQVRVGTLIQAADAPFPPKDVRLIVWQEGGPNVPMLNQWMANVENPYALLPSFGFALLITPVAGRQGYTPEVFNSLVDNSNFGQIDIDEQAEIVQQAIARGWTSKGKVGITGCSYGGYFTLQSIVRYPDLYAAANPQCAFIDVLSEWKLGTVILPPYLEGLPPFKALNEYVKDSPSYAADKVKAAVLTFHGTEDFLPIVQNENFHLQLVNRGAPARMVRFIFEGHGLSLKENQLYAAQEQISWFRTHLK